MAITLRPALLRNPALQLAALAVLVAGGVAATLNAPTPPIGTVDPLSYAHVAGRPNYPFDASATEPTDGAAPAETTDASGF